ncbi:MAG: PAS domain S-box protein, partial [Caulobacterales bacterium]|nr:PAS domain S-box protein [Caulobacterales bacterium]
AKYAAARVAASVVRRQAGDRPQRAAARLKGAELMPAYNALLDDFAPASALISAGRELLHTFGDGRRFLRPPTGVTNLDIANMVDSGLRTPLATGIDRCLRERKDVVFPDLPLRDTEGGARVRLRIKPLFEHLHDAAAYLLIIFEEIDAADDELPVIELSADDISRDRVADLELELKRTRETLQATIEELETANEELQSANEELMAANEELQSTNEEINSVNEELYTVNAEHQRQNTELVALNADIESLMRVTSYGVIFLDERLIIRRFTSAASALFNIITEDIGRSISHITHRFAGFDVEAFVRGALSRGTVTELERLSDIGEWWLLRCVPHDFSGGGGRGAVLTAQSINELKSAQLTAAEGERRYRDIAELTGAVYAELAASGRIYEEQPEWGGFMGLEFEDYSDDYWFAAAHPADRERVSQEWASALAARRPFDSTFRLRHRDGGWLHVHGAARPSINEVGEVSGWAAILLDVERNVQAQGVVRGSEELLKAVSAASPRAVSYISTDGRVRYVNPAFERDTGRTAEDIIGRAALETLGEDTRAAQESMIAAAMHGERREALLEGTGRDGRVRMRHVIHQPHFDSDGAVAGVVASSQDVSHLKSEVAAREGYGRLLSETSDTLGAELLVLEPDTLRIAHANRKACEKLGFGLEEMRRMRITDLSPGVSESKWSEIVDQATFTGPTAAPVQSFLVKRSGETYDCALQVQLARDGERVLAVVWTQDITDLLAVARALRDRTAELTASNRDLEQFASVASHDLRAPLRHITHFANIIREQYLHLLPEDGRRYFDTLSSSATRLQVMVSKLLEYSKIGRSDETFAPVDLNEVV